MIWAQIKIKDAGMNMRYLVSWDSQSSDQFPTRVL